MARYIDADLIQYTKQYYSTTLHGEYTLNTSKNHIDAIPTADVIEIKHGHWTYESISYTPDGIVGYREDGYRCSVCNGLAKENGKFCTNCAAIMDEETE